MKLEVEIAGVKFRNPVLAASGTFGYGKEYEELVDLKEIGGFVTKSITLEPTAGNPPPRICEVTSGMINSIGLQNEGMECFIKEKLPFLRKLETNVIVSIAGYKEEEYVKMAAALGKEKGICALELNLSCPNINPDFASAKSAQRADRLNLIRFNLVRRGNPEQISNAKFGIKDKKGGNLGVLHFAQNEKKLSSVVGKVRKISKLPVFVKLTPNVTDITILARAAERAGADALTVINTPLAMAVDINERKPKLKSVMGGLSGPAIKPIALRMVWQVFSAVKIPIIGVGGISSWEDAVEFMLCGASLVQIGTASFVEPETLSRVVKGIEKYLKK